MEVIWIKFGRGIKLHINEGEKSHLVVEVNSTYQIEIGSGIRLYWS